MHVQAHTVLNSIDRYSNTRQLIAARMTKQSKWLSIFRLRARLHWTKMLFAIYSGVRI